MATLRTRIVCALRGHAWEFGFPSRHSWCRRCKRCDDHPAIVRADKIVTTARKWLPVWITLRRRDLTVRVGWERVRLSTYARVHFGWQPDSELPGVVVSVNVWRFDAVAGAGFAWANEDGERSLVHGGVYFDPTGISEIVCRLRGHVPGSPLFRGQVFCERCHERLSGDDEEIKAA